MPKNRSNFIGLISLRRTVTISTLLIACAFAPCSHNATADEINAASTAKPVGFAEVVAKVKPAVIAVTVRLESSAQMEKRGIRRALAIPAGGHFTITRLHLLIDNSRRRVLTFLSLAATGVSSTAYSAFGPLVVPDAAPRYSAAGPQHAFKSPDRRAASCAKS
jgi:hypothetical protein